MGGGGARYVTPDLSYEREEPGEVGHIIDGIKKKKAGKRLGTQNKRQQTRDRKHTAATFHSRFLQASFCALAHGFGRQAEGASRL